MREKVGLRQPLPEVDVGRLALDVVRLPLENDRLEHVQWSEFNSVCDDVWVYDDVWA